jgi:hypothetical protein
MNPNTKINSQSMVPDSWKKIAFFVLNFIGLAGVMSYSTGQYSGGSFFAGLAGVVDLIVLLKRGSNKQKNASNKLAHYILLIVFTVIAFFMILIFYVGSQGI